MKNVVEYKTARTTEYALLTQPIINDNRNRREEKPEVQMGGAGPAVGRLPAQSGGQTGIQRGASAHPRGLGAERCGRRYDRHGFQPVLCHAGPDRRIYRRPFQPQMDRDGERPLLEHRHHVHGTLQRVPDAGRDAQHRNGRRRSLLRACELLAHRRLPRPDASLRHVDPPDGLLCRDHPQRVCRRRRRRTLGLAQRLLHLRRHRGSPRHNHGRTLARPQTSCDRADRKRGGGTSRNPVSPKDSASFSRLRRHSF